MIRTRFAAVLAGCALLAGCGSGEGPDDLSEDEVADRLASVQLTPGRWETSTEVVSAGGPLPKAAVDRLVGRRSSGSSCITPEQAERPSATFLAAQQGADCAYHSFEVSGGRLAASMTCAGGSLPARMRTDMRGAYGSSGYDLTLDMRATGYAPGDGLEIRTRSVGRRTGDC